MDDVEKILTVFWTDEAEEDQTVLLAVRTETCTVGQLRMQLFSNVEWPMHELHLEHSHEPGHQFHHTKMDFDATLIKECGYADGGEVRMLRKDLKKEKQQQRKKKAQRRKSAVEDIDKIAHTEKVDLRREEDVQSVAD